MRSPRRKLRRSLLTAMVVVTMCGGFAEAAGIGVVLAPEGERVSENEALYAEAVTAALVAEDHRATFLHEASPLVCSAGISLPSVTAGDDWIPLVSVLTRIAQRLRLDYVLLTSLSVDQGMRGQGLLVVRGGGGNDFRTELRETYGDAAADIASRAIVAMQRLPAPTDVVDDAVPLTPVEAPDEGKISADTAAPVEIDNAQTPADDRPLAIADEPEPQSEPENVETDDTPPELARAPIDDALAEAEAAYEDGKLEDAEALLNVSLREVGASSRAYYLRARLALARQDRDAAIGDLKRVVALESSLVEAQVWLGRLQHEQGLWQVAQDHYERAVEADPTHLEALLGLARLYRDHGHRRKAITLLTKADDLGQKAPSLLMLLAELHGATRNVELAERYFVRAAADADGEQRATAWERLGDLYVNLHRHREALTCYVSAAELNPSRTSMVERRYTEVMTAADGAVREALTDTWSAFEDFAQNGIGAREIIYRRLDAARVQLDEAMRFADSIKPPKNVTEMHTQRQFAYALAVEASVLALSYLDLGDEAMLQRADVVHADAVRQFELLNQR